VFINNILKTIVEFLGPVYLICAVWWFWSSRSSSDRLARILKYSAIFWAIVLTLVFAFAVTVEIDCGGIPFYGSRQCGFLPSNVADPTIGVFVLSYGFGLIYGTFLSLVGGIVEWRTRSTSGPSHNPKTKA
jgi:hypothetical protein